MTEQTLENTRTVDVFLHALQDADLETAGAASAEDLVYQNVGLPDDPWPGLVVPSLRASF
jgi:limonene-1,2-epoxide hydrolase